MPGPYRLCLGLWFLMAQGVLAAETPELVATIREVEPLGKGHVAAIAAVKELSQAGPSELIAVLRGFDGATPLATNWLLGAAEAIADRAQQAGKLPAAELEAFVIETKNHPAARRIAYEWLLKVDEAVADRLIPGMLLDPSAEFRRDAVSRKIAEAQQLEAAGQKEQATAAYQAAFQGAVDDDQVKQIVKPLRELGTQVDLQQHFGFLTQWKLIGPFDNTEFVGFNTTYPPENELKYDATYPGKMGDVLWTEFATTDEYGTVDLTKALAPHKGAVTYAATTFDSAGPQQVEIRLGTPNAWKLWVNGELVFARDEYHRGSQLDQYKVPVSLKAGTNTLLLKVCQNEQKEDWAQKWEYKLRICDSAGAAIAPAGKQTSQREPARTSSSAVAARLPAN